MTLWTVTRTHDVARMVFCDQAGRNRLSTQLFEQARSILDGLASDGVRVVILSAEPVAGIWSSGHDIGEIPEEKSDRNWDNPLEGFLAYLRRVPIAVIAEVDGDVWGGAVELMLSADLIVARRNLRFTVTPARLGVGYPCSGISRFLSAFPVQTVNELFFTASPITSERSWELGVINRLVADGEDIEQVSATLAEQIAANAPLTIAAVKAATGELTDAHLPADAARTAGDMVARAWLSDDLTEGLAAFAERRRPHFGGH